MQKKFGIAVIAGLTAQPLAALSNLPENRRADTESGAMARGPKGISRHQVTPSGRQRAA